jgi:hypothetical protein
MKKILFLLFLLSVPCFGSGITISGKGNGTISINPLSNTSFPSTPIYIQNAITSGSSFVTSISVSSTQPVVTGDLIVIGVSSLMSQGSTATISVTDGVNNYQRISCLPAQIIGNALYGITWFYATASKNQIVTATATLNNQSFSNMWLSEWGGGPFAFDGATPFTSYQLSSTPSLTPYLFGSSSNPDLVLNMANQSNGISSWTPSSGYTMLVNQPFTGVAPAGVACEYSIVAGTFSNSGWTMQYSTLPVQMGTIAFTAGKKTTVQKYIAEFFTNSSPNYSSTTYCALGMATNSDGISRWNPLPADLIMNNVASGNISLLRDPSTILHWNGKYYMAYTNASGNTTNTISVSSSSDMFNWYHNCDIDFSGFVGSGSEEAVAGPQWFVDTNNQLYLFEFGGVHYFDLNADSMTYVTPTDNIGLTTWGSPSIVHFNNSLPPPAIFYDPFPILVGTTYYMYSGNLTTNSFNHALLVSISSSVVGPYTVFSTTTFGFSNYESPCTVNTSGNNFTVYLDALGDGEYYSLSTSGPTGPYTNPTPLQPIYGNSILMQGLSVNQTSVNSIIISP